MAATITNTILKRAFEESRYMQSVGSGDVQTITNLVDSLQDSQMTDDEKVLVLSGGIAAVAMILPETARQFAEELLNATDSDVEDILAAVTPRARRDLARSFGEVQFVTQNGMLFMLTITNGEPEEPFQIIMEDGQPTVIDGDQFNWSERWNEV